MTDVKKELVKLTDKGHQSQAFALRLKAYIAVEKCVSNIFREKFKTETKNLEHEKYYEGEVVAMQRIEDWIKKQDVGINE